MMRISFEAFPREIEQSPRIDGHNSNPCVAVANLMQQTMGVMLLQCCDVRGFMSGAVKG